jgi:hypothetical protein
MRFFLARSNLMYITNFLMLIFFGSEGFYKRIDNNINFFKSV